MGDEIILESGVADGKPFVTVTWGTKGGQLDPEQAIRTGLFFISAANASLADAAIFNAMKDIGASTEAAAAFLKKVRELRGYDPD